MRVALRAHLEALGHRGKVELGRDRGAVPLHEWRRDFEDPVAIDADHLCHLHGSVAFGVVKLLAGADVDFAQERASGQQRQRAVHGGPRNGVVDDARPLEQLFRGEMIRGVHRRVENGQPLTRRPQSLAGEESAELFARGLVAHEVIRESSRRDVNAIHRPAWSQSRCPAGVPRP